MNAGSLEAKLTSFAEHGPPRTVARFDDHAIMERTSTPNTGDPVTAAERCEIR